MTKARAAVILAAAAVFAAGCASLENYKNRSERRRYATNQYPDNPVNGLRTVGIVVIDAAFKYPIDTGELTSALHTQLQQVTGIEVVPDTAVLRAVQQGGYALPLDGVKAAEDLGLDGLILAIVTDYDPYGEPVLAMGLTLFSRAASSIGHVDIDKIIQGGRDLPMPTQPGAKPVTAVFDVFDASQKNVRQRLEWFAAGRSAGEVGLSWQQYYRTMPNYMRFVSYEMVWKLFTKLQFEISRRDTGDTAVSGSSAPAGRAASY